MTPYIIAINSISGGGKTTITTELQKRLKNSRALFFDDRDYDSESGITDICKWVDEGSDVNKFNLTLLAEDINHLITENPDYIILDYPFGYKHKLIGPYINYSIYIDTPLDIALARRVLRDYTNDTIAEIFDDMKQYLETGRNVYLSGVDSIRTEADFIINAEA